MGSARHASAVRISALARLAGTTPRTVRYYHQIGLLPVPVVRGGVRDYDVGHLARMLRIRWLADAGVSLGRIDAVLGEETDRARTAEQDLRATLETARERLAELAEQLERLTELLGRIQQTADGERLSPLSAPMASFYAHVEEQTRGSEAQAAVRRERDFVEFAWLRGDFPAEATAFFDTVTAQDVRRSAEAFARANRPAAGSPDMAAQGAAVAALVQRWGGAGEVARRAITLFGLVGDAADAGLAEEVLSRLGVDPHSASLLDGEDAVAAHPDDEIDGLGGEPPGRHPAERGTRLSQRHVRDAGANGDCDRRDAQER